MGCVNSRYSPDGNAERRLKGNKEDATKSLIHKKKEHSSNRLKEKIERDNSNSEAKGVARNDNKSDENVALRSEEKKNIGAHSEFVEGWPKWLVDNIPPNMLDSFVPKSVDSYEKLGKSKSQEVNVIYLGYSTTMKNRRLSRLLRREKHK
ncbi:uncharacterized protein LOC111242528 [Vigna radiata var. radiata]|uniref:Uncharacterized protein LOC111242528 n=1 Tax=Vigna radiata var. radiata TaxID=3916 RepID=A0A3Q0FE49_VIGRR|nr:uncharacterized protein LOC111242528 [Vigna radiata var. radiata]